MRRIGICGALGLLGLLACGTRLPTTLESGEATPNLTSDGGSTSDNVIGDGGDAVDASDASAVPTGGNGVPDACVQAYKPGPDDVYVTATGTSDADCGTMEKPCSLSAALAKEPSTINIASGKYTVAVTLMNRSIRIFGGWTATASGWTRTCESGRASIESPEAVGMNIDHSNVTLSYVDVSSKSLGLSLVPAETVYGVFVTNHSRVTLDHVNATSHAGGKGIDGPERPSRSAASVCDAGTGLPGNDGNTGKNGSADFGPSGPMFVNASDGTDGTDGQNGTTPPLPVANGYNCVSGDVAMGADPNTPSPTCTQRPCTHQPLQPLQGSNRGSNGCGGPGGYGGFAGTNAGSSIALYVSGHSTVSVIAGALTSGDGGQGGRGSPGVQGAMGTAGQAGQAYDDYDCHDDGLECTAPTCLTRNSYNVPGGAAGGDGGKGGNGGNGGNGASGHSYVYVHGTSSSVELSEDPAPVLTPGKASNDPTPAQAAISRTFKE